MRKWTQQEINFIKDNYSNKLNNEIAKSLNRGNGGVAYMALKLKLKKKYDFYCISRKKNDKEINKELLENFYFKENKSMREISNILKVGKTTIEHYFNKFNIRRRERSEANKIRATKYEPWQKGLTKEKDERQNLMAEKVKEAYRRKRENKFREIEIKYGKQLKEIITYLYWEEKLTQEKIAKKLRIDRLIIIKLMNKLDIKKRPNFENIASLKGKEHSMYGKKWEEVYGIDKAKIRKNEMSIASRKSIIRRLVNREMPFKDTEIERIMASLMINKEIKFVAQYSIEDKFVCDFVIPTHKIAIECDGDYWHANPKIYDSNNLNNTQKKKIQTDKFKDKYLKNKGWVVLRFFESEIKKTPEECINKIQKLILERKISNPLDNLLNNKI